MQNSRFVLQAWDRDLIGSHDMVGEASFSLQGLFTRAQRARQTASRGSGGSGISSGAPLRYPSDEASRLVAEDAMDGDDNDTGDDRKPGRAAALKALRKGQRNAESIAEVSARLVEAGHGHWTPEELEALKRQVYIGHDSRSLFTAY